MTIQYNTGGCPAAAAVCVCVSKILHPSPQPPLFLHLSYCLLLCHKFYIQLALPISPEIMDRFLCSRCLNDRVKVPDMIRLFAGGATTPLVVKI